MDPGAPAAVRPPWAEPAALLDLVDELRGAGYNIGVEEYLSARLLLLTLAVQGESLDDPARLKPLLGPLLCSSLREQGDFGPRFDQWLERSSGKAAVASGQAAAIPARQPEKKTGSRWEQDIRGLARWRWISWVSSGVFTILIMWAEIPVLRFLRSPAPSGAKIPDAATLFPLILVLLLPAAVLLWRWQVHRFLRRRITPGAGEIARVPLSPSYRDLFPRLLLFRVAQTLRRRREVPSSELDVGATLDRTLRRGGWLTLAYGRRQETPEYLVLVDRSSPGDQQARLFAEILAGLAEQGVFLARYDFNRDPRTCFPHGDPACPVALQALAARHPSHRLLLFSDGAGLFSSLHPELEPWTDLFVPWEKRALLTPEPRQHWGFRERVLAKLFTVSAATLPGISAVVQAAGRNAAEAPAERRETSPFPEDLRTWPLLWIDRRPPEASRIESALGALRRFLGDAGFYWLSACAVYPALDWSLTVFLGETLREESGARLLDLGRLASLVRTPWLRHGYMPDWLRVFLLAQLPRERQREVRLAVQTWLLTAGTGQPDGSVLEIARRHRASFGALARRTVRWIARREPPESPLRDRVFVSFLSGRRNLAVRLPAALRPALRRLTSRTKAPEPKAFLGTLNHTGTPWDRRREVGFWRGFFQTWWLFVRSPRRAFSMTLRTGDLRGAVLFQLVNGLVIAGFGAVVGALAGLAQRDLSVATQTLVAGLRLAVLPIGSGFIYGLPAHGTLWASNRFRPLKIRVGGTLRAYLYAGIAFTPYAVSNLFRAVNPGLFGSTPEVVIFIWWLVLVVLGIAKIHDLSVRRAALVGLSPLFLLFFGLAVTVLVSR